MFIPGWVIAVLTFPGVILHELAHKIACDITGVSVYRVCYFRIGNPAGYVEHAPPRKYSQAFIIATAPFLVNSIVAILIFTLALKTPLTTEIYGIKLRYILYWLGISIGMHAFPSSGDAKNLWDFTWAVWRRKPYVLLGIPIIVLIYIANALSFFWFDAIYALILLTFTVSIVKTQVQSDTISNFAKDISETTISFANEVKTFLIAHLNINFNPDLSLLYPLVTLITVITISYLAIAKVRKKKQYKVSVDRKISNTTNMFPTGLNSSTNYPSTTNEKNSLYAKCAYCDRVVYLPYKCNYCGQYFCDEHRLPFNHNCPEIESYKDTIPPPGGMWRYSRRRD